MRPQIIVFIIIGIAACGGGSPASTTSTPSEPALDREKMNAEMIAFRDLMSPKWTMQSSPERMEAICAMIVDIEKATYAVQKSQAPASAEPDQWAAKTASLVAKYGAVIGACRGGELTELDLQMTRFEAAFHDVMEVTGAAPDDGIDPSKIF